MTMAYVVLTSRIRTLSFTYLFAQDVSRVARSHTVLVTEEINTKKIFYFHYIIELQRVASSFKSVQSDSGLRAAKNTQLLISFR